MIDGSEDYLARAIFSDPQVTNVRRMKVLGFKNHHPSIRAIPMVDGQTAKDITFALTLLRPGLSRWTKNAMREKIYGSMDDAQPVDDDEESIPATTKKEKAVPLSTLRSGSLAPAVVADLRAQNATNSGQIGYLNAAFHLGYHPSAHECKVWGHTRHFGCHSEELENAWIYVFCRCGQTIDRRMVAGPVRLICGWID